MSESTLGRPSLPAATNSQPTTSPSSYWQPYALGYALIQTQKKWDRASRTYDLFSKVEDRRLGPEKQRLLAKARGKTLHVAAGAGNDFKFFPPGMDIVSIDISPKMLDQAKSKATSYKGSIELREADVHDLALQLPFRKISESMGNHDSKIVGAGRVG